MNAKEISELKKVAVQFVIICFTMGPIIHWLRVGPYEFSIEIYVLIYVGMIIIFGLGLRLLIDFFWRKI
jgi:hypothetical protein